MPGLPGLIVVTDRRLAAKAGHTLVDVVAAAVGASARAVLLREKDLPVADRSALADALVALLAPHPGAHLLIAANSPADGRAPAGGGHRLVVGAHLAATATAASWGEDRPEVVGRSCHDLGELRRAADEGVDYVTYSPVWATTSKPGYGPTVGLAGLERACATVPDLPVYALGGVTPPRVAACREAGAAGVAVMGAVMRAPDPAAVVCEIRAELGETGRA